MRGETSSWNSNSSIDSSTRKAHSDLFSDPNGSFGLVLVVLVQCCRGLSSFSAPAEPPSGAGGPGSYPCSRTNMCCSLAAVLTVEHVSPGMIESFWSTTQQHPWLWGLYCFMVGLPIVLFISLRWPDKVSSFTHPSFIHSIVDVNIGIII